jgi:hypothetical protein
MSTPEKHCKLIVLSGPNHGQIYNLSEEQLVINEEYVIVFKNGCYIVSSLTDKEILFNQELAMEAIVGVGDQIVTESGEYKIIGGTQESKFSLQDLYLLLLGCILCCIIIFLWPIYQDFYKPTDWQSSHKPSFLNDSVKQKSYSNDQEQLDIEKQETIIAYNRALTRARLHYKIAESYEEQQKVYLGGLFWSIKELEKAATALENLSPKPDLLEQTKTKLENLQLTLKAQKKNLYSNAQVALKSGKRDSYILILNEMLELAQDPQDDYYRWAIKEIHRLQTPS